MNLLNSLAHLGLGFWTGWTCNDPKYRIGGLVFLASFLSYQWLEAWRKQDQGWPETKEYMIGVGIALAVRRFLRL